MKRKLPAAQLRHNAHQKVEISAFRPRRSAPPAPGSPDGPRLRLVTLDQARRAWVTHQDVLGIFSEAQRKHRKTS